MELVEIDALHAQPLQRSVAFLPDRFRLEHALRRGHRIVRIPDQSTLGEDHRALRWCPFAQQPADHFLGMTKPVYGGRIYPVHPELECVTHGRQRNAAAFRPPAERPAATADRPGAKSGFGDHHAARAERSLWKVHRSILQLEWRLP